MKVYNMTSARGNTVANQFIIEDDRGNTFFQSYDSMIAKRDAKGKVTLDSNYWDYSATTGRYRNDFLGEGIADTRKKIEAGVYKLGDLN